MPSDVINLSDSQSGETYSKFLGIKHYALQRFLKGEICFPFTREGFGCGAEVGMENGEEKSLVAKVGNEILGITLGTRFTSNIKWSYKSKDCEYCHPEICYPNSTLKEWKCKNRIARWKSETIEREFHSDSLGEIDKNCISNYPRCKCQEQSSIVTQQGQGGKVPSQFLDPVHSVIIIPVSFRQEQDSASSDDTTDVKRTLLDDASKSFSDSLLGTPESSKTPEMLGVLEPTGYINWLYPHQRYPYKLIWTPNFTFIS